MKGVYVNLIGVRGVEGLVERLYFSAGFRLDEVKLGFQFAEFKWTKVAETVFANIKNKLVVLDEVQEIVSPYFLKLLKNLWDTYPELRLVFTGSYVGVLKKLLEPSPSSPLHGRQPAKIVLKPFTKELSIDFLEKGFKQFDREPNRAELEETVEKLNGYVGWLTYYGNFRCVREETHQIALNYTLREGLKIMTEELNRFLENKKKDIYVKVLRTCLYGAPWSEIADNVDANQKVLSQVIGKLVDVGFLEKDDRLYVIHDPVLRAAVKKLRAR